MILGYVLHKGSSRFKGSELGKGRNLTAFRIERTWEKLHPGQTKQESPATKQPVITAPNPSVHTEAGQKPQANAGRNNPVYESYTEWQPDRLRTEFEHDGKNYDRYIPEKVLDYLNDECDFREVANWQPLQNLAIAFFYACRFSSRGGFQRWRRRLAVRPQMGARPGGGRDRVHAPLCAGGFAQAWQTNEIRNET